MSWLQNIELRQNFVAKSTFDMLQNYVLVRSKMMSDAARVDLKITLHSHLNFSIICHKSSTLT